MDVAALLLSLALPWSAGCAVLRIAGWPAARTVEPITSREGRIAATLGVGYFVGLLLLTIWMRILSATGVAFGRSTIGIPLAVIAVAATAYSIRRMRVSFARVRAVARAIVAPPLPRWQRVLWILLLGWMTFRFATLAVEIGARPLYPWDAWTQWATKARVWYALGRIVPFSSADDWLVATGGRYFDVSPSSPATVSLLQAWSAIALGRWDDTATNWTWLGMLIALALAVYGMLRDSGLRPLLALTGAYLVASLPLLDTHVALAGDADLLLSSVYALAGLALYRWGARREGRDGVLALVLAVACPFIDPAGRVWIATLAAGLVVALAPRHAPKLLAWGAAAGVLAIVALAGGMPLPGGFALRPGVSWRALADAFLLFGNWHLFWCVAAALAIVGARRLVRPPLAPLTAIVGSALAWLVFASFFSADVARWFPEAIVISRAALHVTPLSVCLAALLWHDLAQARERADAVAGAAPTHA